MTADPRPAAPARPCPARARVIRVAFAGHRDTDPARVEAPLARAFALVAEAAAAVGRHRADAHDPETVLSAHAAIWPSCTGAGVGLALLAGYAPGADRAAVRAWRAGGYGPVHALFPFADGEAPERYAWTHGPGETDRALRVDLADAAFDAHTVLDGAAGLVEEPRRDAHLEQARWLTRWADVVLVLWDGGAARGTGGTADAVALASRKGLPILWIDIGVPEPSIRLIPPDGVWLDGGFSELLGALESRAGRDGLAPLATAAALTRALLPMYLPPRSAPVADDHGASRAATDDETGARRAYADDPLGIEACAEWDGAPQTAGERLRRRFAEGAAGRWQRFYRSLSAQGAVARSEAPPPPPPHTVLEEVFRKADRRASLYGNLHRGLQARLLVIAVLAVAIGTLPAVVPGSLAKLIAVALELALLLAAYGLWRLSLVANNHQRWSDARRLAERLRMLRATRPLGFDVGDDQAGAARTWTEWYARAVRRAVGPPRGFLADDDQRREAAQMREDENGLIAGQAAYHRVTRARMAALHHRLQGIETRAFWGLVAVLGAFFAYYLVSKLAHGLPGPPAWIGGLVLMMSAVIPTVAAACLALEAKIGVEESERRSARLAAEFETLRAAMESADSLAYARELARGAAHLHLADIDTWRDAAVRRRMVTI